jgi:hypothetical protein
VGIAVLLVRRVVDLRPAPDALVRRIAVPLTVRVGHGQVLKLVTAMTCSSR